MRTSITFRLLGLLATGMLVSGLGLARAANPESEEPKKPTAEEIQKAQKQAKEEFAKLNCVSQGGTPITDDFILRTFPKYLFFTEIHSPWPVDEAPGKGLSWAPQLYAVSREKDGKLAELGMLETFFKSSLGQVKEEDKQKDAVRAWLVLASVFHQDGYYQFKIKGDSIKVSSEKKGKKVTGTVVASKGGKGELTVTFTFDEAGNLAEVKQKDKIEYDKREMRPICQSSKLLAPDPIIRGMAEQQLLLMGLTAQGYLEDRRAKVDTEELRQAIDRIWERILEEDRRAAANGGRPPMDLIQPPASLLDHPEWLVREMTRQQLRLLADDKTKAEPPAGAK